MQEMVLPRGARELMARLNGAGYHVYVVGGSTRDALRGLVPHDYDMTTDATPEEMKDVFRDHRVIETGIKHGTLTILADGVPYEITTYRVDGNYRDHRHPDGVSFTRSLEEDLARRDFTMNAIAYTPGNGFVDLFGGYDDIRSRVIRAVGDPTRRFREDALRILRALRFASTLDFTIDPATAEAARKESPLLAYVSAERIREELCQLLVGTAAPRVIAEYASVLQVRLPRLTPPSVSTLSALSRLPADPVLRLMVLLLPSFADDDTDVNTMMHDLRFDNAACERAERLILHIGDEIVPQKACILRLLSVLGEEGVQDLCTVRRALTPDNAEEAQYLAAATIAAACVSEGDPYRVTDLAISGADILTHTSLRGADVGKALHSLLDAVMDGALPNTRDSLLSYLKI